MDKVFAGLFYSMAQAQVRLKTSSEISAAQRRGDAIITTKKYAAASNRQKPNEKHTRKIEEEQESFHIEHVSADVGKAIMQARQAKGLTQKDLATKINEKPQIVSDYETGKGVKNQNVLAKMEKVLGVKLRGKEVGYPLVPPKK
ncbi:unnamed protein product [Protopolystoma xenopodis]|uniref:HTH cro/C1-type domain-containing protein n=1 Tax=Protopolystoma xenopodis TaxID=117903 RepID=A0A448WWJ1_9PLAT|nr:unnamed protein product [Protopolystoma xenopodis]